MRQPKCLGGASAAAPRAGRRATQSRESAATPPQRQSRRRDAIFLVKAYGDGAVTPGIVERVAAIGGKYRLDAGAHCRFTKRAGLIASGRRDDQHATRHLSVKPGRDRCNSTVDPYAGTPAACRSMVIRPSGLPACPGALPIQPTCLHQSHLLCSRLRSTVPRLVEIRHRRPEQRGRKRGGRRHARSFARARTASKTSRRVAADTHTPTSCAIAACSRSTRGSACRHGYASVCGVERTDHRPHVSAAPAAASPRGSAGEWRAGWGRPARPGPATRADRSSSQYASSVVQGWNATNVGDSEQVGLAAQRHRPLEIGARVALLQNRRAPSSSIDSTALVTNRQPVSRRVGRWVGVPQQMLDLDRDVVGEPGKLARDALARVSWRGGCR